MNAYIPPHLRLDDPIPVDKSLALMIEAFEAELDTQLEILKDQDTIRDLQGSIHFLVHDNGWNMRGVTRPLKVRMKHDQNGKPEFLRGYFLEVPLSIVADQPTMARLDAKLNTYSISLREASARSPHPFKKRSILSLLLGKALRFFK